MDETVLMRVYGAGRPLPERLMLRAVGLAATRTFEQDPKYAIWLLVDIAIRALSRNDVPTTACRRWTRSRTCCAGSAAGSSKPAMSATAPARSA